MSNATDKVYDLEERTFLFAKRVRQFVKRLPRSSANYEDSKQVIRSSGSVGANYIEANEAVSPRDRVLRIRIARKEAKETQYWLRLLDTESSPAIDPDRVALVNESNELVKILSAIMRKLEASLPR